MRKPKRSKLQKRKDNPRSTTNRDKADAAWSLLVRARWGNKCAVCGGTPVQAHHLIPKDRLAWRHELGNGMALCATHHIFGTICSAHGAPLGFAEWLQAGYPSLWEWVQANKWTPNPGKPDYKAALERLATEAGDGLEIRPTKAGKAVYAQQDT